MAGPFQWGSIIQDTNRGNVSQQEKGTKRPPASAASKMAHSRSQGTSCRLSFSCQNSDSQQSQGLEQQEYILLLIDYCGSL